MIKILYSKGVNKQQLFNVSSGLQASSVLHMKENSLYYDFLLRNQISPPVKIGVKMVEYVFNALDMPYVECPTSSDLDFQLMDQAQKLFKLAEKDQGIKSYIQFNFRLLHKSFINTVLSPLLVISKHDDCEDMPETFTQKMINQEMCYYDSRIPESDVQTFYQSAVAA